MKNEKCKILVFFDNMIANILSNKNVIQKLLNYLLKKIIVTIDDKIRYENLQNDINRKGAKISALSSGKIDKYDYFTGKEILLSDKRRVIELAKFTYCPVGKALKKQLKIKEKQMLLQIKAKE